MYQSILLFAIQLVILVANKVAIIITIIIIIIIIITIIITKWKFCLQQNFADFLSN